MKKREYKIKIENGEIKFLDDIDLSNIKEGIVIFFENENTILKHAGKWNGPDIEQCLNAVYEIRGETEF